ncbi:MAG: nucleotidyltransferase domain-containing protein [Thermoguttaceae bacterium]
MISTHSKITQRILTYFFANEDARRYVNELARLLDADPKNLYLKLIELEEKGLLESEFSGKQRYFSLNKRFPLLQEYHAITQKSFGLPNTLASTIKSIKGISEAYIFGSFAKNAMDEASDIDLLVVGSHSPREIAKSLKGIEKHMGRIINVVNISKNELNRRKKDKDPFVMNIFSEKHIKIV